MEYAIVSEETLASAQIEVNNLLAEGWQVYGSLSVNSDEDGTLYTQALIKNIA